MRCIQNFLFLEQAIVVISCR